jgi:hypothetical protein
MYSIEKTKEEKIKDAINNVAQSTGQTLSAVKQRINEGILAMYYSDEYTPQEYINMYGNQGVNLVSTLFASVQFVKALDPSYEPLATGYTPATLNQDGTVTVGEKIIVEEPAPVEDEEITGI